MNFLRQLIANVTDYTGIQIIQTKDDISVTDANFVHDTSRNTPVVDTKQYVKEKDFGTCIAKRDCRATSLSGTPGTFLGTRESMNYSKSSPFEAIKNKRESECRHSRSWTTGISRISEMKSEMPERMNSESAVYFRKESSWSLSRNHSLCSTTVGSKDIGKINNPYLKGCTVLRNLNAGKNVLDSKLKKAVRTRGIVIDEEITSAAEEDGNSLNVSVEDETSLKSFVMQKVQSLKKYTVLRHRKYKRKAKRNAKIEFYRNKYKQSSILTESSAALKKENDSKESKNSDEDANMGVFGMIKNTLMSRFSRERNTVRDRIAHQLAERRKTFDGMSRAQIVGHIQTKYFDKR